jgi:hypothetical protein
MAINSTTLILTALFNHLGKETAYLDPGSGSFILQLLIASLVGAGFLLRGYWSKLIKRFRGTSGEDIDDEEDSEDEIDAI